MSSTGDQQQHYERALALHRGGQLGDAAALYREVLASEPGHFGALHLLGVIEGQRRRYAEAIVLIEQAIGVDSTVAAAHANLGNAQCGLGLFDQALMSYQRAVTLEPGHRWALMGQGKASRSLGRLTEALASYEAALDIDPDCSESLMNRGDILLLLGRPTEGVVSLRRAADCGADPESNPVRAGVDRHRDGSWDGTAGVTSRTCSTTTPTASTPSWWRSCATGRLNSWNDWSGATPRAHRSTSWTSGAAPVCAGR